MKNLLLWCLLLISPALFAQSKFIEGQHYFELKTPQAQLTGDKVEVLEIFSYACPHCGHVAPTVSAWKAKKPKQAELRYLPAVWQKPSWPEYAAVFFSAKKLGVLEKSHDALFDLLYVKQKPPQSLDEVAQFFTQFGIKAEDFVATMNSEEVRAQLADAAQVVANYEIEGTPAFIVGGRWRFDVTSAGGQEQIAELINYLVDKSLQSKKS
jgi:thiol:disulfide interchange protein DsbA